mmetsp:Transcript_45419/g.108978  ORF Transcript_45419/g.108978 Transcript_45419/m.108978 type:complete len:204 (+) Transcript_45419:42-653(+)
MLLWHTRAHVGCSMHFRLSMVLYYLSLCGSRRRRVCGWTSPPSHGAATCELCFFRSPATALRPPSVLLRSAMADLMASLATGSSTCSVVDMRCSRPLPRTLEDTCICSFPFLDSSALSLASVASSLSCSAVSSACVVLSSSVLEASSSFMRPSSTAFCCSSFRLAMNSPITASGMFSRCFSTASRSSEPKSSLFRCVSVAQIT